jgi:hypothetical protein
MIGVSMLIAGCPGEPGVEGANASGPAAPSAQTTHVPVVVSDSAVGCLEIGARMDAVTLACGEPRDTTIYLEGMPQEAAWIDVGPGRALAEVVNEQVWRIRITDSALSTRDSIRVGVPINRLADHPGIRIGYEEGISARTDAHCGMTFGLTGPLPFRRDWTEERIRALPDEIAISLILVFGRCSVPSR